MRLLYFLLSATLLVSCATTRSTNTEIFKAQVEQKTSEKKDSVGVAQSDSTASTTKDSTGVSKKSESDSSGVALEFGDEDSAAVSGPVKVIISGDTLLIDPGGRKLTGVKYNTHKSKSQSDSSKVVSNNTTQLNKLDSSAVKSKAETQTAAVTFSKKKVTERETSYWPPWWVWVIAVIVLIVYFRYQRWKKKPGNGLPVFENPPPPPEKRLPDFEHIPPTPEVPPPPDKDNFSSTPMI